VSRGWLCVFAKAPRPGRVKTRLSPPLSPDDAAALYAAMLADVLAASLDFADRLSLSPELHFDPPDARDDFARRTPAGFGLVPQRGDGLAARMANAFAGAAASGFDRMLLRGSDSPGVDLETFEEALARLDAGDDVVLTPDQGGGYALIALREPHAALFEVRMSTGSVLDETLARAQRLGLVASLTRPGFDLDRADDLARLGALPAERSSVLCPRTVEMWWRFRTHGVL